MAPLQTNQDTVPQDMVTRVGSAGGRVARIQQDYALQAEAEITVDARQTLAAHARVAAERVLDEQGVSVQEYNQILTIAENDPDLEQRLLNAAREVL